MQSVIVHLPSPRSWQKCSAGFQPAHGPVDAKGVIQAHMPARRRRYDSFSWPASPRWDSLRCGLRVLRGSKFSPQAALGRGRL